MRRRLALLLAWNACLAVLLAPTALALVFGSPDTEPATPQPPNFPYWEHVTQRRYNGPSVIYLGAGFALTARHVGMGEIFLDGEVYEPVTRSQHTILNESGSAADAMIFELERDQSPPDWPLLPIAARPPEPGEDLLLIGFGRGRERVIEVERDGVTRFGFIWTDKAEKRWGTNRTTDVGQIAVQRSYSTRAIAFDFDPPDSPNTTRYEAQAAVGDSGGAVFVERDGVWKLAGMMISVSSHRSGAFAGTDTQGSAYGDRTWAVDLSHYRDEILRWTRAACSNERDDDGDDRIDFPQDPGCDSATDRNERDAWPGGRSSLQVALWASGGIALVLLILIARVLGQRRREGLR